MYFHIESHKVIKQRSKKVKWYRLGVLYHHKANTNGLLNVKHILRNRINMLPALTHSCILLWGRGGFFKRKREQIISEYFVSFILFTADAQWRVGEQPQNYAKGLICSFSAAEMCVYHTVRQASLGLEMQRAWINREKGGQNENLSVVIALLFSSLVTLWRLTSSPQRDHLKTSTDKSQQVNNIERDRQQSLATAAFFSQTLCSPSWCKN